MKKLRMVSLMLALLMAMISIVPAFADETVVVTSPFTAAVAEVRSSVVVVNKYANVTYNNYNNYGGFGGFGGFGFGFPFDYGYGYGNRNQPESEEVLSGFGSGVVIADEYVLTNYHVVDGATRVSIGIPDFETGDAKELKASLAGYDENLDLAIVYIPGLDLKPVQIGDSDKLMVGDWAICIGNPLSSNYYGTVTVGVVSALNRAISNTSYDKYGRRETNTVSMIQTDAAINSGNSGGGMFSVTGELVGVPAQKSSGTSRSGVDIDGISLCIPINLAKPLIETVVGGGIKSVTGEDVSAEDPEEKSSTNNDLVGKPRLGITIQGINTNSQAVLSGLLPNGVMISAVEADSPADEAGLQEGDIIVEMNGTIINTMTGLTDMVGAAKEGDVMQIRVFRVKNGLSEESTEDDMKAGEYVDVEVTLRVIDAVKQ